MTTGFAVVVSSFGELANLKSRTFQWSRSQRPSLIDAERYTMSASVADSSYSLHEYRSCLLVPGVDSRSLLAHSKESWSFAVYHADRLFQQIKKTD